MAADVQRNLRRCAVAVAVCLASIWAVRADPGGIRPTEHGLAYATDPGPASATMMTFFRPGPELVLPEAQNVSEPAWSLVPPGPQQTKAGRDRPRTAALIAVSVLCGVVGLALLVAASMAYVIHVRRSSDSGRSVGSGSGFGLLPRGCQEIRLGAA